MFFLSPTSRIDKKALDLILLSTDFGYEHCLSKTIHQNKYFSCYYFSWWTDTTLLSSHIFFVRIRWIQTLTEKKKIFNNIISYIDILIQLKEYFSNIKSLNDYISFLLINISPEKFLHLGKQLNLFILYVKLIFRKLVLTENPGKLFKRSFV